MAENAFAAALLKMAAEHRLKAESARNMIDHYPERTRGQMGNRWRDVLKHMNAELEHKASEHEGLAEVYEAFANRIIADVAGQLIMHGLEKLTGPAELLGNVSPELFRVVEPYATENWARTWLHYYRGMDLPGERLILGLGGF